MPHVTDDDCATAIVAADGMVAQFIKQLNGRTVPAREKWTPREAQFAHDFALQAVRFKRAELTHG